MRRRAPSVALAVLLAASTVALGQEEALDFTERVYAGSVDNEVPVRVVNHGAAPLAGVRLSVLEQPTCISSLTIRPASLDVLPGEAGFFTVRFGVHGDARQARETLRLSVTTARGGPLSPPDPSVTFVVKARPSAAERAREEPTTVPSDQYVFVGSTDNEVPVRVHNAGDDALTNVALGVREAPAGIDAVVIDPPVFATIEPRTSAVFTVRFAVRASAAPVDRAVLAFTLRDDGAKLAASRPASAFAIRGTPAPVAGGRGSARVHPLRADVTERPQGAQTELHTLCVLDEPRVFEDERFGLFWTPSRELGFSWRLLDPRGEELDLGGLHASNPPANDAGDWAPTAPGAPGRFARLVEVARLPGRYTLETRLDGREPWQVDATFDVLDARLHFQGFVVEPRVALEKTERSRDGTIRLASRVAGSTVTIDAEFEDTTLRGERRSAASRLRVDLPAEIDLMDGVGVDGPGAPIEHVVVRRAPNEQITRELSASFRGLFPTIERPPRRELFAPRSTERAYGWGGGSGGSTIDFAATGGVERATTELKLVLGGVDASRVRERHGRPARPLFDHLRDERALFALPLWIGNSAHIEAYGFAIYGARPGTYDGPTIGDAAEPAAGEPAGTPGPEAGAGVTTTSVDPWRDARVKARIDEFLSATEPFPGDGVDADGGPWRWDPWGRTLSPTITATGPPDDAGRDRHEHLWTRRADLTSLRDGTLDDWLAGRPGTDLSGRLRRRGAGGPAEVSIVGVPDRRVTVGERVALEVGTAGLAAPLVVQWTVGGKTVERERLVFRARVAGHYAIEARVRDATGREARSSATVEAVNDGFRVHIACPRRVDVGVPARFEVVPSGGFPPYQAVWTIDGEEHEGLAIEVGFGAAGPHAVSVRLRDAHMREATAGPTTVEAVQEEPLTATLLGPSSVTEGQQVLLRAETRGGRAPLSFSWAIGDQTFAPGGGELQATLLAPGLYSVLVVVDDAGSPPARVAARATIAVAARPRAAPAPAPPPAAPEPAPPPPDLTPLLEQLGAIHAQGAGGGAPPGGAGAGAAPPSQQPGARREWWFQSELFTQPRGAFPPEPSRQELNGTVQANGRVYRYDLRRVSADRFTGTTFDIDAPQRKVACDLVLR